MSFTAGFWLVRWDFVLCRKITGLSEFRHFSRGKLGSDVVPHAWREGTEGRGLSWGAVPQYLNVS